MFTFLPEGLELIKKFEGCALTAYKDIVGVLTIGYGHTLSVHEGDTITQEQADTFLNNDIEMSYAPHVNSLITNQKINNKQFSALVCFAYNVGVGSLKMSSLLKYVNENQIDLAAKEFPKWDHAGGLVVKGLLNRRLAEATLFTS